MLSGSVCHRDQRWQARENLSRRSAWRPVRAARTGINAVPKPRRHSQLRHCPSPPPSTGPPGAHRACRHPDDLCSQSGPHACKVQQLPCRSLWIRDGLGQPQPQPRPQTRPRMPGFTRFGTWPSASSAFMAVFGFSFLAIVRALWGSPLAACLGRSQNPPHHRNTDPGHRLAKTHRESH